MEWYGVVEDVLLDSKHDYWVRASYERVKGAEISIKDPRVRCKNIVLLITLLSRFVYSALTVLAVLPLVPCSIGFGAKVTSASTGYCAVPQICGDGVQGMCCRRFRFHR